MKKRTKTDSKDNMKIEERNRELAATIQTRWVKDDIRTIERQDGSPRGKWVATIDDGT